MQAISKILHKFSLKKISIYILEKVIILLSDVKFSDKYFIDKIYDFIKGNRDSAHIEWVNENYFGRLIVNYNSEMIENSLPIKRLPIWMSIKELEKLISEGSELKKNINYEFTEEKKIPVMVCSGYKSRLRNNGLNLAVFKNMSYLPVFNKEEMKKNDGRGITVIIPYKNAYSSTYKSVMELLKNLSNLNSIQIILVNNNSDCHNISFKRKITENSFEPNVGFDFIDVGGCFNFSNLINSAVKMAKYEYIISCNNDVYMRTKNWDQIILSYFATYPDTIFGIKLSNNNKLDSIGVYLKSGITAVNIFEYEDEKRLEHNMQLNKHPLLYVDAVSAAFMGFNIENFKNVSGFDEVDFQVALNDVAYCVRSNEMGINSASILEIEAEHIRGYSRPSDLSNDQLDRYMKELERFRTMVNQNKYYTDYPTNKYGSIPFKGILNNEV